MTKAPIGSSVKVILFDDVVEVVKGQEHWNPKGGTHQSSAYGYAITDALFEALWTAEEKRAEYLDLIKDLAAQGCVMPDGTLDSCAISTNADALRELAKHNLVEIEYDAGRRVIGKWIVR